MFSPSKAAKEILSTIYEKYSEKPGTMLVHTGAIGWVLSSMAQITALIFNDKITPEQKMFLIPQEVGDACVNILSFYAITESIKNIGKKLTKTGKIRSQELSKLLKDRDLFLKDKSSREAGKVYVGDWDFDITKLSDYEKNIKSVYKPLNNGVEVVTGLTGSILSSNIITPFDEICPTSNIITKLSFC